VAWWVDEEALTAAAAGVPAEGDCSGESGEETTMDWIDGLDGWSWMGWGRRR